MAIYEVVIGSFTSSKSVYRTERVEAVSEQAATDSVNISTEEFWACTNLIGDQDAEYNAHLESVGFFEDVSDVAFEVYGIPF